eukprot:TRINITY_DN100585_c0_g1_i2.p1 TRINITY_DN100585_c0_g1~~TRINITY_DN100585_c0_g1_i2.p1  ORF type:complete len:1067 (-),score=330.52 TRINITY_DN100585_c0_g1_i2:323-3523(-)
MQTSPYNPYCVLQVGQRLPALGAPRKPQARLEPVLPPDHGSKLASVPEQPHAGLRSQGLPGRRKTRKKPRRLHPGCELPLAIQTADSWKSSSGGWRAAVSLGFHASGGATTAEDIAVVDEALQSGGELVVRVRGKIASSLELPKLAPSTLPKLACAADANAKEAGADFFAQTPRGAAFGATSSSRSSGFRDSSGKFYRSEAAERARCTPRFVPPLSQARERTTSDNFSSTTTKTSSEAGEAPVEKEVTRKRTQKLTRTLTKKGSSRTLTLTPAQAALAAKMVQEDSKPKESERQCHVCTNYLMEDARFCRRCGTRVKVPKELSKRPQKQRDSVYTISFRDSVMSFGGEARENGADEQLAKEKTQSSRTRVVFRRVADDGAIHKDDLPKAVELMDLVVLQKWIDEAYALVTDRVNIALLKFEEFLREYKRLQIRDYNAAFTHADADGSGYLDSAEVAWVLASFGIEPLRHVLQEVISEVDMDADGGQGRGEVNLQEFHTIMHIVRSRQGFSKREYDALVDAFSRFDQDGSGDIEAKEMQRLLQFLGYTVDFETVVRPIVAEADADSSGQLAMSEFLVCMRQVRDYELRLVKKSIAEHDKDGSGTLAFGELCNLMRSLGLVADTVSITDALGELGFQDADNVELDFSQVWLLIEVFRTREGLANICLRGCDQAMQRHGQYQEVQGELALSCENRDAALRWMACTVPFQVQQLLTRQVDIDGSGMINIAEFRKLVRMCYDRDFKVYVKLAIKEQKSQERLDVEDDVSSGSDDDDELTEGRQLEAVDFFMMEKRAQCKFFRGNAGFSSQEVAEAREFFTKFDEDESGTVEGAEMIQLIDMVLPDMARNASLRPQLIAILKEVDRNGDGAFDLGDFLMIMRKCADRRGVKKLQKEAAICSQLPFSSSEIHSFRAVFVERDTDRDDVLSLTQVKAILEAFMPMGAGNSQKITRAFHVLKDLPLPHTTPDEELFADFPEFLQLMDKVVAKEDQSAAAVSDEAASPRSLARKSTRSPNMKAFQEGEAAATASAEALGASGKTAAKCSCGNVFLDDARFCRKCGEKRPVTFADGS